LFIVPSDGWCRDPKKQLAAAVSWTATADFAARGWAAGLVPRKFVLRTCDEARKELAKLRAEIDESSHSRSAQLALDEAFQQLDRSIENFRAALKRSDHTAARFAAGNISDSAELVRNRLGYSSQ
jgi:hypothetical protein